MEVGMEKVHLMDRNEKRKYVCWRKWMQRGEKTGCHQNPDRSLFVHGYQMPVCARCTGVIIGYLIAVPTYLKKGFCKKTAAAGCIIMLSDWVLQKANIKESTNGRRLLTGMAGGFGVMMGQIHLTKLIFRGMGILFRKRHK